MYEMLLRESPFDAETKEELYNIIKNCEPHYPTPELDELEIDLLQKLLKKDPTERLGFSATTNQDSCVISHPYFHDINLEDARALRIKPPFIPLSDYQACNFSPVLRKQDSHFSMDGQVVDYGDDYDYFTYLSDWAEESRSLCVFNGTH
ncbi:hypothetical protein BC833DRAFT_654317 [Globomyces pollinis-pini]|nr:hypothetical protein BC833DRAFT_654317 [Globomyces pollinis-pini]